MDNKGKNKDFVDNQWKEGQSGNPKGRPLGQRDYATIYKEALIKLAALNNKTPGELEDEIVSAGLLKARKGDYAFYRDVLDRIHGKPQQKLDVTSDGKPIFIPSEIMDKNGLNNPEEQSI